MSFLGGSSGGQGAVSLPGREGMAAKPGRGASKSLLPTNVCISHSNAIGSLGWGVGRRRLLGTWSWLLLPTLVAQLPRDCEQAWGWGKLWVSEPWNRGSLGPGPGRWTGSDPGLAGDPAPAKRRQCLPTGCMWRQRRRCHCRACGQLRERSILGGSLGSRDNAENKDARAAEVSGAAAPRQTRPPPNRTQHL